MSELTREQIEDIREDGPALITAGAWSALCDMALRTLDAEDRAQAAQDNWDREVEHLSERAEKDEARIRELEAALRYLYTEAQNESAANGWVTMYSAMVEAHKTLAATPPPDSEPAEGGDGKRRTLWNSDPNNRTELSKMTPEAQQAAIDKAKELIDTPPQRGDALEVLDALMNRYEGRAGEISDADERKYHVIRRALSELAVPDGYTPVPNEVLLFLQGAGPLNGRWYWTADRQEPGPYWWRRYLPLPAHAAPQPEEGEIDRLRRERDEALALLREAQAEIGQQCSIMYNSHASPADGEVHDSEAKVELDRIDDLFRRIGALLASLKGA